MIKPSSRLELSKEALRHNMNFIHELLGTDQWYSVIKGNAYGHGITEFGNMLYQEGQRNFAVFEAYEAYILRTSLPNGANIMIMGMIDNKELLWAIENDISFYVFDCDRLTQTIKTSKKTKNRAKVHLEFETGMNRTGFNMRNILKIIKLYEENKDLIEIVGVSSHLAGAESIANYKRIRDQIEKFTEIKHLFQSKNIGDPQFHLACSAASLQYSETRLDISRIGILQYGFFPSNEVLVQWLTKTKSKEYPLKRVISWKTNVMDTKEIDTGEFVGYGNSFFTNQPSKIALLPVGYSHGFNRSLSNKGKVLINGKRLDVVGTVNMNMLSVDVTEATEVEKGDEVVLIGYQGDQEISVSSFSDFSDTLNYELLTRLPKDIPRIIVK